MSEQAPIGVIVGSGFKSLSVLEQPREFDVETPFGPPSAPLIAGEIAGVPVIVVRRHGDGHTQLPSEINVRANIAALKLQGVRQVISFSAVGSLNIAASPGTFVIVDQYIDRTYGRAKSFFGEGIVAHVGFGDPVCRESAAMIASTAHRLNLPHLEGGTYIVMEGPQFSTRAESEFHRSIGGTVIGMTASPEPKLCREAELCYNTIAMVTDFDCWHSDHDDVTADLVSERMRSIGSNAEQLIVELVPVLARRPAGSHCGCRTALNGAIMTDPEKIAPARRQALGFLLDRVLLPSRTSSRASRSTASASAGLLFDLDGTMLDTDALHLKAFQQLFEERGCTITERDYVTRIMGAPIDAIMADFFPEADARCRRAMGEKKEALFRDLLIGPLVPRAGLLSVIDWAEAKGLGLCVVTNAPRANAEMMLRGLGLLERVHHVLIGEELPLSKPDPYPYTEGLRRLGIERTAALAFEDSGPGVRAASGAGIHTFGIRGALDTAALTDHGATDVINDFTEAALWLQLSRLARVAGLPA
jgi:5'-methylthioadenosine phosphorylase